MVAKRNKTRRSVIWSKYFHPGKRGSESTVQPAGPDRPSGFDNSIKKPIIPPPPIDVHLMGSVGGTDTKKGAKINKITYKWNNTGCFVFPLSSMFGGRNSTTFNSKSGKQSEFRKKGTNAFLTRSFTLDSRVDDDRRFVHLYRLVQRRVGHQQPRTRWKSQT